MGACEQCRCQFDLSFDWEPLCEISRGATMGILPDGPEGEQSPLADFLQPLPG